MRLDFVLPEGTNSFIRTLRAADREPGRGAAPASTSASHAIEGFNPDTLAATLRGLRGETDGVGLIALDHPAVREAMRAARRRRHARRDPGDRHPPRAAHRLCRHRQPPGRAPRRLRARPPARPGRRPAKVALFAGSLSYRGHQEREMGFRARPRRGVPRPRHRRAPRGPRRPRARLCRGRGAARPPPRPRRPLQYRRRQPRHRPRPPRARPGAGGGVPRPRAHRGLEAAAPRRHPRRRRSTRTPASRRARR